MSKIFLLNKKGRENIIEEKNTRINNKIKKRNKFENKIMFISLIIITLKIKEYSLSQINDNIPNITLKIKGKGLCNIYCNESGNAFSSILLCKKNKNKW